MWCTIVCRIWHVWLLMISCCIDIVMSVVSFHTFIGSLVHESSYYFKINIFDTNLYGNIKIELTNKYLCLVYMSIIMAQLARRSIAFALLWTVCRYPSRMEYDSIMSGLMLKFPFLVDFDGSSVSNFMSHFYIIRT